MLEYTITWRNGKVGPDVQSYSSSSFPFWRSAFKSSGILCLYTLVQTFTMKFEDRTPFLLRPIREPDCTFLLLGEEHKHEHWMPCEDTPNCANVQLEFVAS